VAFRLALTSADGVTVNSVQPGSDVWLSVFVRDARASASARGVYAAYLDVAFTNELLSIAMQPGTPWGFDIEFGPEYQNGPWAELTAAGEIDEVGAFLTEPFPLGSGEFLLFRTRFIAGGVQAVGDAFDGVAEDSHDVVLDVLANDLLRLGTARVASNPADLSPGSDVVTFAPPEPVPTSRITYGAAQLDIALSDARLITAVTQPATGGTVAISPNGRHVLYSPPSDFHGQEQFTYTVGRVQTAAVTVQVDAVNDAPVAVDDAYATSRVGTLWVDRSQGVLRNDRDVDRDALSAKLVADATHGSLELRPDGSFDYTPAEGFVGTDQFRYVAGDADLWSAPATVTIEVGRPQASVRLEVVDAAGNPLSATETGTTVWVRGWVRDLRDGSLFRQGLGAVYLDLDYEALAFQPVMDLLQPLGFVVDFAEGYRWAVSGDASQAGMVDELGAASEHLFPPGVSEQLLFAMPFETGGPHVTDDAYAISFQSVGNVLEVLANDHKWQWSGEFSASAADELPAHAVRMWEPSSAVPEAEIVWSDAPVTLSNAQSMRIAEVGPTSQGGQVTITADRRRLVYAPAPGFVGLDTFEYVVRDAQGRSASATVTLEVAPSWQNRHLPVDVNSDTFVTPIDALIVINYLNLNQPRQLAGPPTGPPFWDVNLDRFVTPLDALTVINYLNRRRTGDGEGDGEGEGEGEGDGGNVAGAVGESAAGGSTGAPRRAALVKTAGSEIVSLGPYRDESEMRWGARRQRRVNWLWDVWSGRHLSRSVGQALEWPVQ
jgi:hypothetical protein